MQIFAQASLACALYTFARSIVSRSLLEKREETPLRIAVRQSCDRDAIQHIVTYKTLFYKKYCLTIKKFHIMRKKAFLSRGSLSCMAKFLYTISNYAEVLIEDSGGLSLNVQHWLTHSKFRNVSDISFAERLFKLEGIKCKLKIYYVYELLDCQSSVVFRTAAVSDAEAKQLLFQIIPYRYVSNLKNPEHSKDAQRVLARYYADEAFQV